MLFDKSQVLTCLSSWLCFNSDDMLRKDYDGEIGDVEEVPAVALMHELQGDLMNMGFSLENVINGLRNALERQKWSKDARCLVFSPITKRWYNGHIQDIPPGKNSHLIYVRAIYDGDKTVFMDLYCKDIQPINAFGVNQSVNDIVERTKLWFFEERSLVFLFVRGMVVGASHAGYDHAFFAIRSDIICDIVNLRIYTAIVSSGTAKGAHELCHDLSQWQPSQSTDTAVPLSLMRSVRVAVRPCARHSDVCTLS